MWEGYHEKDTAKKSLGLEEFRFQQEELENKQEK